MKLVVTRCDRCGTQQTATMAEHSKGTIKKTWISHAGEGTVKPSKFPEQDMELCDECREGLKEVVFKVTTAYLSAPRRVPAKEIESEGPNTTEEPAEEALQFEEESTGETSISGLSADEVPDPADTPTVEGVP